ncbi:hypothetical protein Tco_0808879 [Tanacetum coccineum]
MRANSSDIFCPLSLLRILSSSEVTQWRILDCLRVATVLMGYAVLAIFSATEFSLTSLLVIVQNVKELMDMKLHPIEFLGESLVAEQLVLGPLLEYKDLWRMPSHWWRSFEPADYVVVHLTSSCEGAIVSRH